MMKMQIPLMITNWKSWWTFRFLFSFFCDNEESKVIWFIMNACNKSLNTFKCYISFTFTFCFLSSPLFFSEIYGAEQSFVNDIYLLLHFLNIWTLKNILLFSHMWIKTTINGNHLMRTVSTMKLIYPKWPVINSFWFIKFVIFLT